MICDSKADCTCTYDCPRHGKCCECVSYHKKHGEVPGCFFSSAGEKTYNRTIEHLYQDHKMNK
jgi:hypothetical protein